MLLELEERWWKQDRGETAWVDERRDCGWKNQRRAEWSYTWVTDPRWEHQPGSVWIWTSDRSPRRDWSSWSEPFHRGTFWPNTHILPGRIRRSTQRSNRSHSLWRQSGLGLMMLIWMRMFGISIAGWSYIGCYFSRWSDRMSGIPGSFPDPGRCRDESGMNSRFLPIRPWFPNEERRECGKRWVSIERIAL